MSGAVELKKAAARSLVSLSVKPATSSCVSPPVSFLGGMVSMLRFEAARGSMYGMEWRDGDGDEDGDEEEKRKGLVVRGACFCCGERKRSECDMQAALGNPR